MTIIPLFTDVVNLDPYYGLPKFLFVESRQTWPIFRYCLHLRVKHRRRWDFSAWLRYIDRSSLLPHTHWPLWSGEGPRMVHTEHLQCLDSQQCPLHHLQFAITLTWVNHWNKPRLMGRVLSLWALLRQGHHYKRSLVHVDFQCLRMPCHSGRGMRMSAPSSLD